MPYELLGKLYYGDQNAYAQTYRARFDSEDAVRLDFPWRGIRPFSSRTPRC